jgi:hypothetical protein
LFTELFINFPDHLKTFDILITDLSSKGQVKIIVKNQLGRDKNNRKYINSLRKLSNHYNQFESKNIWKINISIWFDLLSEVRHNIVHGRQIISPNLEKFLKEHQRKKIFTSHFNKKTFNNENLIFLDWDKFHLNKGLLEDFGYYVFKSLSIDNNLDPIYNF